MEKSIITESEIINAWTYAWNRHSYRLFLRGYTIEEREDFLGSATIKAYIAIPYFRGDAKLSSFFLRCSRIASIEIKRK